MSDTRALFDRLVTVHRPDCALPGSAGSFVASPVIGEEELARQLGTGAAAAYALQARIVFEDLRRIVGQLAGFLILARLTRRHELLDLPELQLATERWQRSKAALAALSAPAPLSGHKQRLDEAVGCCGEVLCQIEDLASPHRSDRALDLAGDRIKDAYRALQSTASEKSGLVMVDFSHACCNCSS